MGWCAVEIGSNFSTAESVHQHITAFQRLAGRLLDHLMFNPII
jgi:hypothetical protein